MEEQGTDAPSSVDGTGPSVGGSDGGGFSDDAAAVADPVGIAHGLGITRQNPFGNKVPGFIKGLSSIFGPLDYTNQYKDDPRGAQYAMNQIANLNVANTMNPNNVQGVIGFDPNQAPNQPRSGIQKGFGSLFGRPTGQMTTLGPIAAQRSGKPMDALALSIFGMLSKGTPLGLINAIVGPSQNYAVKDSIGYNRDVDPAVSGNQSLGTMADIASFGLTGSSSAQTQDAYGAITSLAPDAFSNVVDSVKDALGFAQTGGKAGTVDSTGTVNSVATNPNMNAKGIDSLGIDKSYRDTMKNNAINVREGDLSPLY